MSQKKLLNTATNLPSYIFRVHTPILLVSFSIHFVVELLHRDMDRKGLTLFLFRLLETDIREQKKYAKRMQTSVDNTVDDLRYEIKVGNRVKD